MSVDVAIVFNSCVGVDVIGVDVGGGVSEGVGNGKVIFKVLMVIGVIVAVWLGAEKVLQLLNKAKKTNIRSHFFASLAIFIYIFLF